MKITLLLLIPSLTVFILVLKWKTSKPRIKQLPEAKQQNIAIDSSNIIFDSPYSLIKRAAELKSIDIAQSIQLIEQAIKISPDKNISYYFKLANYYHYSGKIEEAYTIYNSLINDLNIDNVFDYNKTKAQILEKKCILNYKNEEYENYLFNYCYWLFNKIIGHACQGETVELKEIIYNKNKLNYLSQSKINGCFKKLKIENWQRQFNAKLNDYFYPLYDDLVLMSKLSKNIQKNKKDIDIKILEETLRQNEGFMIAYSKLNSDSFIEFYKSNILMTNKDIKP